MSDTKLAEWLMEKPDNDLTLDNAIRWCRFAELSKLSWALGRTEMPDATLAYVEKRKSG